MTSATGGALEGFIDALLEDDSAELYDRAPCGYLSTDPDGLIVKANQTFLTMTGHQRGDLVGKRRFADLLSAGGRIYHETHYAPMLMMQGTARAIAFELVTRDGGRLPVLVNSVLDRDPAGAPIVVRVAVFDATDRREYERELLRAKQRAELSETHATQLAQTLQRMLMPPTPPVIPGLDVAGVYRPAGDGSEVGGDFFDVFEIKTGDWVVVVGDVRGKGVEAAAVASLARHTLRAAAIGLVQPSDALATLNKVLLRDETERFCTVVFMRLTWDGAWRAVVSSGGHALPLLSRDGALSVEIGQPGTVLGVVDDPLLYDDETPLQPGDNVLLYTDGIPEGRNGNEFYGEERLAGVVANHHESAGALAEAVVRDVLDFQQQQARDDIAIVAVRVPLPVSSEVG
ncbi:MAG TPA: SpoIIE family protein phosphatase [Mycobacteriales bacterium]|nr:SpoIIE family protein phosphatase [Mycobacteriales bacterium]